MLQTGNGVPLVNIQTPSAQGLSRNVYSQFDVDARGVILNNAQGGVRTDLGGYMAGNPWLATGAAKVILNEVQSASASNLQGYVEVAGNRAHVIIANPMGITCSGCGFLNAGRATLTTGLPVLSGGNIESYRVAGGSVAIEGKGLDASKTDYADIMARAVKVNATIWANDLKLTAGANTISHDHGETRPAAGAAGAAPRYAIDIGRLGGMYGGKIFLVGTERGVGMNNEGAHGIHAVELTVSTDGLLANRTTVTVKGDIDTIGNLGGRISGADVQLQAQTDINNLGGAIDAVNNLNATAARDISLQLKKARDAGDADGIKNWSEGGAYRVTLHTLAGGLAGGIGGAAGAGVSAATIADVGNLINKLDLPDAVKKGLIAAAGTAVGAAVGGASGAAAGFNQTVNNYLRHEENEKKRMAKASCSGSNNPSQCRADIEKTYNEIGRERQLRQCTDAQSCRTNRDEIVADLQTTSNRQAELDRKLYQGKLTEQERQEYFSNGQQIQLMQSALQEANRQFRDIVPTSQWTLAEKERTFTDAITAVGGLGAAGAIGKVPVGQKGNEAKGVGTTAEQILNAERIGSGLKDDASHRAASFLSKEQLQAGQVFPLRGGDGVERNLLQTPGGLNGKNGIYEYIYDSAGKVTHQRFIEGGTVTGLPNQRVPKVP